MGRVEQNALSGRVRGVLRYGEPTGAWLALGACLTTVILAAGTRTSLAAFLRPIEDDLGLDRLTLSTAGALTVLAYGLGLPLVGRLAARFGARLVMMVSVGLMALGGLGVAAAQGAWEILFFAGLVPGLGFAGASLVPASALLARWFDRRLGLAAGVISSGIPAGQGLFVPLAIMLIPLIGWRGTYLLLGLVLLAGALPLLYWLAREPPATAKPSPEAGRRRPRAGLDVWLVGAGYFGCGFTDQFVSLHLIALAADAGVDPRLAAGSLSLLLLVGIGGSVASGPLADAYSSRHLLGGLYLLRALSLPLLLVVSPEQLWALGLFALLFGFTYIANQAPGTRLLRDRYGAESVGPLMGNVSLAHQVGGALGVALGGLSVELAGGYGLAVVVGVVVVLAGASLQQFIPPVRGRVLST